jgi:excisionase family DNA binding protein
MTLQPRWLDPDEAAQYVGVRREQLPKLVKAGKLPEPSRHLGPRQARFDRTKIDALFDPGQPSVEDISNAAVRALNAKAESRQKKTG